MGCDLRLRGQAMRAPLEADPPLEPLKDQPCHPPVLDS